MISLEYRSGRPIYEQVRDSLRRLVLTGAIGEGERLPSVRSLASSLAINPNTIQRAYEALEAEGYVYSVPGKGSFAASPEEVRRMHLEQLWQQWEALLNELLSLGVPIEQLYQRINAMGGTGND